MNLRPDVLEHYRYANLATALGLRAYTDGVMSEPIRSQRSETVGLVYSLAEITPNILIIFDASGAVLFSNRAARTLALRLHGDADRAISAVTLDDWHVGLLPDEALPAARIAGHWQGDAVLPIDEARSIILGLQLFQLEESRLGERFALIMRDTSAEHAREAELHNRNVELEIAYGKLKGAQEQLLQAEKLASIGQLSAGVAHEINNPIGYVHSNLGTLQEYVRNLLTLIEAYDRALAAPAQAPLRVEVDDLRQRFDLDFVRSDLPSLLTESREGIERVRKIVQDLKDFSRSDRGDQWVSVDLHRGLESTLNIVWNELKYKAQVVREYGDLPPVECLPSELNQVFMNILVNAGQAIPEQGMITVSTGCDANHVWIAIGDDGEGIAEEFLPRIFDPFFTTKAVGSGTGLGLSISYGIVAKHHGKIDVTSAPGHGTLFRIELPIHQPRSPAIAM